MKYIIYNKEKTILRTVQCPPTMSKIQAKKDEFIMEGIADDATQKVEFDGFDMDGQPINPRVVDKTPEEIEKEMPTNSGSIQCVKPFAHITNEQWQDVLSRLRALEGR